MLRNLSADVLAVISYAFFSTIQIISGKICFLPEKQLIKYKACAGILHEPGKSEHYYSLFIRIRVGKTKVQLIRNSGNSTHSEDTACLI